MLYRRHLKSCQHRKERFHRRCGCPIWFDARADGRRLRKSMQTSDWTKAEKRMAAADQPVREQVTVSQAIEDFLADARARGLNPRTVYKYELLFRQLRQFTDVPLLSDLDVVLLRKFRSSWKDGNLAALKKLERLRSFLRFAQENGWIRENPAKKIANPKVHDRPTLPYSSKEMRSILDEASERIQTMRTAASRNNARRLRALILLMRYSGLRISDAVQCSVDKLHDGRLLFRTQKTGTDVYCPLPSFVVEELDSIPKASERCWFWSGNGKLETAVTVWQWQLRKLFERAGVPRDRYVAHRFRDTFAVELLLKGVPIERVSVLLGHRSVRITEKHYAPWIRERQEQAEADVRRTWQSDPIALLESLVTPWSREKTKAAN